MKIPCEECILLAICKNKDYVDLLEDCSIIYNILYDHTKHRKDSAFHIDRRADFNNKIAQIDKVMGTKLWNNLVNEY